MAPAWTEPTTTIRPSAWSATAVARSAFAPPRSNGTITFPSPLNVVSRPVPFASTRAAAKSGLPFASVAPTTTIIPSGWSASAAAVSMPPNVNWNVPLPLNVASSEPSGL